MSPRAGSSARLTVCLLAALVALSPADAHAQAGGDLPEQLRTLADVRIQGMRRKFRRQLKAAHLKTRKPSLLPWRERPAIRLDYLRADTAAIANLYRHHGHLDARAHWVLESTRDPSAARVVFVVEEGALSRVASVELTGVQAFHDRELKRELLAKPGRPFDPSFLALDTLTLSRLYQERGYRAHTRASGERPAGTPLAVAVRYDILEGPRYTIGRIDVEGSGRLRESLARRELLVRPGDVYRRSRLEQSVERLYDTGLYNQVQISTLTDTAGSALDLLLRVGERRPRWVDLGIGSGSIQILRLSGGWGHRNLNSNALLGAVNGELELDRQRTSAQDESQVLRMRQGRVSANLVEPWLLGVRLRGQASVFYEQAADDRDPRFLHRRDSRGVELGLLREFSRIFHASMTTHSALVHQSYEIMQAIPDTTRDSLQQVLERYFDNGIALSLFRDTRDDRITPRRGSLQTLATEIAGGPLRGASSYHKVHFVSSWYSPRQRGWLFAMRGSLGLMGPTGDASADFDPGTEDSVVARVPKERRFFLGGVNSMRGWAENSIPPDGGLAMLLGNLEMRIPLWGPLGVEAYVDAGNVWSRVEYMRIADFVAPWNSRQGGAGDLRYSYGLGARLLLPFGPLRLDLTWSRHPEFTGSEMFRRQQRFAYQFAIGPSF